VPEIVGVELIYLQLRMICELIALACLTAHGDVPETTSQGGITFAEVLKGPEISKESVL
jgi:hypothetical protein